MGYPKMEKEPKGATASDRTGEKMVRVPKEDREGDGYPSHTGAKAPRADLSSDTTGERKMPIQGGVAMGNQDGIGLRHEHHMGHHDGRLGEMKGHMGEKVVYDHKRMAHPQD
jgi:hypothetical protein